jgi:hypothetical protein
MAKCGQIDLTVYYCSDESVRGYYDREFGQNIKWDIPLLEGYKHKFLKNYSFAPTIKKHPHGLINPRIVKEILRNRYDGIIVHGWGYITHWLVFMTCIVAGKAFFYGETLLLFKSPLNPAGNYV